MDIMSNNVCTCCLKNDGFRDFSAEHFDTGHREVYEEVLKDTFNIQIFQKSPTNCRLICEDCVLRLRDASSFKQMVVKSAETLSACLRNFHSQNDKTDVPTGLQLDTIKVETLTVDVENVEVRHDDHGDSFDDDEILANIKLELTKVEDQFDPVVRPRRRRSKSARCKIKDESEGELIEKEKNWTKIVERRGNGPILRENSLKLLANSTICVFQWNKSRYRCFCCKEPFSDMKMLRNHTNTQHTLQNIEKKIILQQNRLVKAEISLLYCKLCEEQFENLTILRIHLSKDHGINFDLEEDLLVPFKINEGELQCQICLEPFTVFRLLNMHMNRHFQKQVCHICGAGFSNLVFLNLHKTRSHRPMKCKVCGVAFTDKSVKKHHEATVHGVKHERKLRFPCPYCNERFFQENFRVQHLVLKHGLKKPEFKCSLCSKVFITRSLCNNHLRNVHMKEKNHQCDVCHNFFYTKSDVVRHRVTHTGEKRFSCSICNGPFATKDSLRRHMKRTHAGP